MRRTRLPAVVALVLVAAASVFAPAAAAPRTPCQLVEDQTADAGLLGGAGGMTQDDSLDIVSADIATDGKLLTVVIRVSKLVATTPPLPYGGSWSFHFSTGEAAFFLDAGQRLDGPRFQLNHYISDYSGDTNSSFAYVPVGQVSGVIDAARNEVRMTAPLSMFAPIDRISAGSVLSKLLVISWLEWGYDDTANGSQADEAGAGGKATYTAGARNCVAVGR